LGQKPERANLICFLSEMGEGMDALANEVESVGIPFAIDNLEVPDPLEEELMCCDHLFPRDYTLEYDVDGSDKPTEVGIIRLREQVKEYAWTLAVNIVEGLPGLITA
jgi:hypothetical protein